MTRNFRASFLCRTASWLALGATLVFAGAAQASPPYPGEIQKHLNMPCAPTCNLCHATAAGGGIMAQPFGRAIQATNELVANEPTRIPAALDFMASGAFCKYERGGAEVPQPPACDSDEDGTPDIEELSLGQDPNLPGPGDLCGGPRYGCGARIAPGRTDIDWLELLVAGGAAAALIRSARRSRKRC